jgi:outer membrane protein assembly factor BamD
VTNRRAFRSARGPALAILALLLAGCGASVLPSVHSDAERLALARRLAARREWTTAIELLKTYVDRNAGSADVDQAIYLLGECYLKSKDYPNADVEFERLLREYPESDSSASAEFRRGEALFGQARPRDFDQEYTVKALEQWERYLRDRPGHWLNPEAEQRVATTRARLAAKLIDTGELYLKLRQVEPARFYFERVDREYGNTPVAGDAWLGLARCDALEGRRDAAIARLKDLETRFAGQPLGSRAMREREAVERSRARARPPRETHKVPAPPE